MGSLMAGWNAPGKDPRTVKYQRNKSLTNEEISAYWKSKETENGGLNENQENMHKEPVQVVQRSNSAPLTGRNECSVNNETKADAQKLPKTNCWWTRSNWAFLNEPPVIATEGTQKYVSQFNVAKLGGSRISAKSSY